MKISLIHICFGEMCKRCYRQASSDMSLFTQSISQRLLFPLILQHAYRKQGFRYLVFLHVTRESSHIIQVAVSYYSGHACFGRSDERNDTNLVSQQHNTDNHKRYYVYGLYQADRRIHHQRTLGELARIHITLSQALLERYY